MATQLLYSHTRDVTTHYLNIPRLREELTGMPPSHSHEFKS